MRRALWWGAAGATLATLGTIAALLLQPLPPGPDGPEPGRSLFRRHCATCHGPDGRGGSWRARLLLLRPGDLGTPQATGLPDAYLMDVIRQGGAGYGKPGMPSFGFVLDEREIRGLIAYVRTLADVRRGAPARIPSAAAPRRGGEGAGGRPPPLDRAGTARSGSP